MRTIASVYSAVASIIGIIAVIAAFYTYSKNEGAGLMIPIMTVVFGALIVLGLLAASESIRVFVDIEENTRRTNG